MTASNSQESPQTINRRTMIIGGTSIAATAPVAISMAMQDASPEASPSASPQATPPPPTPTPPPPSPTPQPVPEHAINIVRGRASYGTPEHGGELSLYIQSAGFADGNPALQSQDMALLMSVFDGLVRINPETMEAEPGLAKSWSWSDDGLVLTFNLRQAGLRFHRLRINSYQPIKNRHQQRHIL